MKQFVKIRKKRKQMVAGLLTLLLSTSLFPEFASAAELARGDVDGGGLVTLDDACLVLEEYARLAANYSSSFTSTQEVVADIDCDEMISVSDAVYILTYYAKHAAGQNPSWEDVCPALSGNEEYLASTVLQLINEERSAEGLSALTTNDTLKQAAKVRAEELVTTFSHTRPDGTEPNTILDTYGVDWSYFAENIASGQDSAAEVVTAWMNSTGHRKNILNANYTSAGVAVCTDSDGRQYWEILFIG